MLEHGKGMTTESCCSRGTGAGTGTRMVGVAGGGGGGTMEGRGGDGGGGDHHENNHHNNNSSDCAAASDCESDCSQFESSSVQQQEEDQILKRAEALTMEEVIQRRVRRLRKLMKVYRSQYWGLVEEMRTKYRRLYLRHGKSGWRDDVEDERDGAVPDGGGGGGSGDGMREPERRLGVAENAHCAAQGCTSNPLSLSVFCFAHILLEPRQRLYKPCSHVIRTGQTCGKPVLRAVVPPLCGLHFHRAQRQATKSLNKALPGGVKFNPKIHLIVSQYVRVIQSKRRHQRASALAAKVAKVETAGKIESNGKEVVLSQQVGGPPRSSSSTGGVATRVTAAANANAHPEERKPLANGQSKEKNGSQAHD
ncbi:unnamed protein product [Calypogeia fissa]